MSTKPLIRLILKKVANGRGEIERCMIVREGWIGGDCYGTVNTQIEYGWLVRYRSPIGVYENDRIVASFTLGPFHDRVQAENARKEFDELPISKD